MVVAISTLKSVFPSNSRKDCEDRFSIQFKEGLEGNLLKIINQIDCTHLYIFAQNAHSIQTLIKISI